MKEFLSGLGFVFEGAFKLGFLERVAPELKTGFRNSLFEKLREYLSTELIAQLQKPIEDWEKIDAYIDQHTAEDKYTKLAYLFGYYAGRFYGLDKERTELIKYHMGEESWEIVWQNADLLFIKDTTLYVVDFKLAGFTFWIKKVFEGGRSKEVKDFPRIPVINYGVPINLSVGELEFVNFVKAFVQQQEVFDELKCVFVEVKGFAQLLCYAVDYLLEEGMDKDIREVVLELLYPASESLRVRFYLRKNKLSELEGLRDKVREIYKNLKNKECSYDMLDDTFEKVAGKRERVLKKLAYQIEELKKEISNRESEGKKIKPDPIKLCREDVRQKIEDFLKREDSCKAICLLHSAGSGKTSTIREQILKMSGQHLVIYMATRLRLIEKEIEKLKNSGRKDIDIIIERSKNSKQFYVKHSGIGFEDTKGKEGIVKRTIERIALSKYKYDQIWTFITQQALTDTDFGNTIKHLSNSKVFNKTFLKRYQIHIILDEFLGYRNGLYAINGLLEYLKKVQEMGGRANLYIFDANGYSPYLLKKLLEEYKQHGVVPDSIVVCPFEESIELDIGGIPMEIHAKHGYPADDLYIHKKFFLWVEKEEDLIKAVGEYVKETLDRKATGFLFVQNKSHIVELAHYFEKDGFSTLVVTASSKRSPKEINEGYQDIILGTSSVSRGLDFSRPHKPVNHIYILVTDWGIEQNLVEILQAISRARGDEKTEKEPKHLHLIYAIPKEREEIIDNIESLVEFKDRELIELIYKKERISQTLTLDYVVCKIIEQFVKFPEEEVLVPIPAQHRSVYRANRVAELESIKTFLEDVYLMESKANPEKAKMILYFLQLLSSAVYLSTNHIPKDFNNTKYEYFHPYLVIYGKVNVGFDNEKREILLRILNKLEETLKKHDEEKAEKVKDFVENTDSIREYDTTFLLPVYSLVFVNHALEENGVFNFRVSKRVGRGGAVVLGGGLDLITRCLFSQTSSKEYAVIPLGEDYPYIEVLSGRFAKFPVEFLHKLLEGKDAGIYSKGVGR